MGLCHCQSKMSIGLLFNKNSSTLATGNVVENLCLCFLHLAILLCIPFGWNCHHHDTENIVRKSAASASRTRPLSQPRCLYLVACSSIPVRAGSSATNEVSRVLCSSNDVRNRTAYSRFHFGVRRRMEHYKSFLGWHASVLAWLVAGRSTRRLFESVAVPKWKKTISIFFFVRQVVAYC